MTAPQPPLPPRPLQGPLDVDPTPQVYALAGPAVRDPARFAALDVARAMLDTAVAGLPLGAYDARIVDWLKGWDVGTVATLASLLARARTAGTAGHPDTSAGDELARRVQVLVEQRLRQEWPRTVAAAKDADRYRAALTAIRTEVSGYAARAGLGEQGVARDLLARVAQIVDEAIGGVR